MKKIKKHTVAVKKKNQRLGFRWERIAIVTTGLAVLFFVFSPTRHTIMHSVQGAGIVAGLYDQATIPLPHIPGAKSFNIYYKSNADGNFTNAVRNISPDVVDYTVSYLTRGKTYQYKISAVNVIGSEFWFSPTTTITDEQAM